MDGRYREYAQLALAHSLELKRGERVLVQTSVDGLRFAELIGEEVIRGGGHVDFLVSSERVGNVRMIEGSLEQLRFIPPTWDRLSEFDCRIVLDAPSSSRTPTHDPDRLVERRLAVAPIWDTLKHQSWVYMLVPTRYLAHRMGLSWAACQDLLFRATVGVDWNEIMRRGQAIKRLFDGGRQVRILSRDTDISFDLGGRPGRVTGGRHNLPDGECFYAPVSESVEGTITFPDTQGTGAGLISGLELTFRGGRVVDATAHRGMDKVEALLTTDAGAACLGEFGIGVNPLVQSLTGNILFDEKIAGTVHLALGDSFPDLGGTNKSAVHWDSVLDLRRGGEVYLDGRLVCLDGQWLLTDRAPAVVGTELGVACT